jgi:hypothetical protein
MAWGSLFFFFLFLSFLVSSTKAFTVRIHPLPHTLQIVTPTMRHLSRSDNDPSTPNDDYYTQAQQSQLLILQHLIQRKTEETQALHKELQQLQESKRQQEQTEREELIARLYELQTQLLQAMSLSERDTIQSTRAADLARALQWNNGKDTTDAMLKDRLYLGLNADVSKRGKKETPSSGWLGAWLDTAEGFFLGDGRSKGATSSQ